MKPALLFLSIVLFPFFLIAQDTTPPTPVLKDNEDIQIQEDSIALPAHFFNIGSYDNQTDSADLQFAYSEDVNDSLQTFYCHNRYGQHVQLYVFDTSGNYAHEEIRINFQSQDCPDTVDVLLPTPYCLNGIATFADSFGVDIPASVFNAGSFDDQTPSDQLKYSYSEDLSDTLISVNCDDIGTTFEVYIYVHDLSGKSDYCRTYYQVTSGENCNSNTMVVDELDTIPPRLIVLNGIATLVIPRNNIIRIEAKDFVIEAYDNITNRENLRYSFSKDTSDQYFYATCAHEGTVPLDIYCFDEAGNWSKVSTYAFYQTQAGYECDYPEVDTILPSIVCPADTNRFYLEEDSVAHVYVKDVIDTAYDDFTSYEDMFLSFDESYGNRYEEFGCNELGYHTFNFQASDLLLNSSTCEATIEIVDTLGICQTTAAEQQLTSKHIQIYPNPASDRIHINVPIGGELHIIDALGRQVRTEKVQPNVPLQLNVQTWNSGVYSAVLVNQKGERKSTLFVIQ